MRVGIYNRYWGTMGGGEKHVGTIAEVLLAEGYDVDLIRVEPIDEVEFASRMNLDIARARWVDWPGLSCADLAPRSAIYDVFINSTYCSSMVTQAERSMYLVFFPHDLIERAPIPRFLQRAAGRLNRTGHPNLARLSNFARRMFRVSGPADGRAFIDSYQLAMTNSEFTASWVHRRWARDTAVVPPPIDTKRFSSRSVKKKKVILSVGRFFSGGHNKKHIELITAFRSMCDDGVIPDGWEYHLAGSVHTESKEHRNYFDRVNELAQGYPIKIMGNLASQDLLEEYEQASIFWHGAGWGEHEEIEPEKLEHFGMTACESMAAGVIPIVVPKGGPKEIVTDGVDGFYFRDEQELRARTVVLMQMYGTSEQEAWSKRAQASVDKYSRVNFHAKFMSAFRRLV
ncbi:hypothetical protein NB699_000010 [Xanthomonas sacchari]|uniref:Glycosyltransferase n=1 Tax=Xanthomonas sacchari TaxID=56458 RepID=A0AA46SVR1_9XANT|nr:MULTISPECIES: glycosyltransferase [Xanthomonas]KAB7780330.1 hypothetical protein CEK66_04235 [Xanthomonas sp. LMG 12460]MCW0365027.1 hypothetical protein [Xanthomonas sacchari]MCW0439092.1 hypothetical protein [Xanthomonas sacchari]UYK89455.1 glycosyltransferase [Xanthomonas sacchari]